MWHTYMAASPPLLRWQQGAVGICWCRSPHCPASAKQPQPRSQHPCSSPAFSTAALTCGNWKNKLRATWRNKGQRHPQTSHLGNWLCAELSSSVHVLHRKCCKTKPSDAFYFFKCSSFCTTSPCSFTVFFCQCPALGTHFHAGNGWLQWRFQSCCSWAPRGRIPSLGFVRIQNWVVKRRQPATAQTSLSPNGGW